MWILALLLALPFILVYYGAKLMVLTAAWLVAIIVVFFEWLVDRLAPSA